MCALAVSGIAAGTVRAGTPIRLTFRDTTVASGTALRYPLYVDSSLSGYAVSAYQVEFTYNSNLMKFDSASSAGTLSKNWGIPTVAEISPGRVRIAAAGADTLAGNGVLVTLAFHSFLFTGLYNQGSSMTFQSAVLNQGSPSVDFRNGTVTLTPGPSITVAPNTALLTKGDVAQFGATGGTAPYGWVSTAPSVATVDATGKLTAVSAGVTRLVATDFHGFIDTSGTIEVRAFKLTVRDTSRFQGQTLILPIYCSDVTGLNITSGQFTAAFAPSLWTADSILVAGTMLAAYPAPVWSAGSGSISISFAGTTPLTGSGILLYIRLKATSITSGGTQMTLQNSLFNETLSGNSFPGNLTVTPLSTVTVSPSGVQTMFTGDSLQFTASGGTAPYTWTVSDSTRASISSAGYLKTLKSGDLVVRVRDVLGSAAQSSTVSIYDFRLSIPDTTFLPSASVQVPVYVTGTAVGYSSVQLSLTYPAGTFIHLTDAVTAGTLTAPFTYAASGSAGTGTVAAAGVNPVFSAGVLMYLVFAVPDSTPISSFTSLTVSSAVFNEGSPRPLVKNGSLQIGSRAIIQVLPNPVILNAAPGSIDSAQVAVNNTGNLLLTAAASVVGSSAFSISSTTFNVSPGVPAHPKVYFHPSVAGPDSAVIQFTTNDPFHATLNIPVKGNTSAVGVQTPMDGLPHGFILEQNYPNPFNPSTRIGYSIPAAAHVSIGVYDVVGRQVAALVNGPKEAGSYTVVFDASGLPSGVYFYELRADSYIAFKKLVVMK